MRNDSERIRLFTRRAFLLGGAKITLLSTLAARLYYLQILKSDEYKTLSDSNRIKLFLIPPLRGNILDRSGNVLAMNQNHYRVMLDKEHADNVEDTLRKFVDLLNVEDEKKQYIIRRVLQNKSRGSVPVYDHLSWQDVARIEVNIPDLPGISVEVGQIRYYPFGTSCSHLIGYVGAVSEEELEAHPLLNHPDFRIGKNGLEKTCETLLQGRAGIRRMEVNAHGLAVRELSREESVSGKDLTLTLDVALQEFATSKLDPRGSSVVVVDVRNGDVLALAATPGFDPNQFPQGISAKYWAELHENPYLPLLNRTISVAYPPGSTFKLMVALASLQEGIDPSTTVHCPGYVMLGNRKFHCWREGGHGTVNMSQAIMHSCNSYFYTMARRIGVEKFAAVARMFGLGGKTGIELVGEKSGVIPDRKWKRSVYKKEWQMGDTLNSGIGQGFTLATPLQLAIMAARIASGKEVKPHLLAGGDVERSLFGKNFPPFKPLDISAEHMEIVRNGMRSVVNVPGGTAYGSRIPEPRFAMAGKTGTSQVVSKKYPGQDNSKASTVWENRNHGLFVGFAPADNPKYACSVVVEHGGSGSGAAAPIAKEVLLEVQKREES